VKLGREHRKINTTCSHSYIKLKEFLSRKDKVWSLELGGGQSEEHWLTGTKYSYIGGITSNIL
jgi:hypothetical protein